MACGPLAGGRRPRGPRPSLPAGPRGPRGGGAAARWTLGRGAWTWPLPFLLREPRLGTDHGDVLYSSPRGDRERIVAPLENPDAWVPSSQGQMRRPEAPVTILSNHHTPGGLVGLGVRGLVLLEGWGEWWEGHRLAEHKHFINI